MKRLSLSILGAAMALAAGVPACSQNCQAHDEIPAKFKTSMESAAQKVFDQASRGDVAGLRSNAIPSLQSSFTGIAGAVNDNKAAFAGARPQLRESFLLDTGPTASVDGHFYCGVFGAGGMAAGSAEFELPGLPHGEYAIVIQDFIGSKGPYALTTIFQDMGGWRLAGFYVRPETALGLAGAGHLHGYRVAG